jgi:hypothetical protein
MDRRPQIRINSVNVKIKLLKSLHLPGFPSGSSINFHHDRFYVIGDDSTNILVLDKQYQHLNSIHLFDHPEKRIPKVDKVDLEGSTVIKSDGVDSLLIVGSASRKNRKRIIKVPLTNPGETPNGLEHSIIKTKDFVKRIKNQGIEEVNIEGVTIAGTNLLLANRGNRTNEQNHLFLTTNNFWEDQDTADLQIIKLDLPSHQSENPGLSEICYLGDLDILLLTLTSENTANAYDDGEIGDSYLGLVNHASSKLKEGNLMIDVLVNLTEAAPQFKAQKIEGVCVESANEDSMVLHLVSDNDLGESTLFKVELQIGR